jgi:hypothetical protein
MGIEAKEEDNIKVNLRKKEYKRLHWVQDAVNAVQLRTAANSVTNDDVGFYNRRVCNEMSDNQILNDCRPWSLSSFSPPSWSSILLLLLQPPVPLVIKPDPPSPPTEPQLSHVQ